MYTLNTGLSTFYQIFSLGVNCIEEVSSLFRGELNPVAAKAQKKVQVPEGWGCKRVNYLLNGSFSSYEDGDSASSFVSIVKAREPTLLPCKAIIIEEV